MLAPAAALAQNQNPSPNLDRDSQNASRRSALAPGAAAATPAAAASEEIPFEKILANPGDLDLNERFAHEQIDRGDLRGAATTLERVLILAPGRDGTRLLYAAVLIRLDALTDAERELEILLKRSTSAEINAQAKDFQKVIAGKKRRTHFDVHVTVGFAYDNNRNSAADSDQNLFFGTPILLNPDSRRQDDTNVNFAGQVGVRRDLGGAKPWNLFANVGYYRGEQTRINSLDLQAYSASAGANFRFHGYEITPSVGFDHVLLSQSTYLRDPNQTLRVSKKVRPSVALWGEIRHEDQRFVRTPLVLNSNDRTGDQYDLSLGAIWVATPRDRVGFTIGHRRKLAVNSTQAYRRESAGLDYTHLLGRGMFLAAGLSGQFDRYDQADPTLLRRARSDDAMIASLLLGVPLDLAWKPLKGFMGTVGVERFQQTSNLLNYDYSNDRLSASVSYKWGI